MPLYDFRCPVCRMTFEVSRPIARAADPVTCPLDGAQAVRVFTPPNMVTKRGTSRDLPPAPSAPSLPHHGHTHDGGAGGHSH